MGNVVVWKPSDHQAYSAQVIVDLFKEAGLPDGVINVVYGDPVMITDTVLASPDFLDCILQVLRMFSKIYGNKLETTSTFTKHILELLEKLVEKILSGHTILQILYR